MRGGGDPALDGEQCPAATEVGHSVRSTALEVCRKAEGRSAQDGDAAQAGPMTRPPCDHVLRGWGGQEEAVQG